MKARLFIAIELDSALKDSLQQAQNHLRALDLDVKWVQPENMHLTLKFLGDIKLKNLPDIQGKIQNALAGHSPFDLQIGSLGAFPDCSKARVIWAGLSQGRHIAIDIAQQIESSLTTVGIKKKKRSLSAHMTLGRVRSKRNIQGLQAALDTLELDTSHIQTIKEITLFQSKLTAKGPIYTQLESFRLN